MSFNSLCTNSETCYLIAHKNLVLEKNLFTTEVCLVLHKKKWCQNVAPWLISLPLVCQLRLYILMRIFVLCLKLEEKLL